MTAKKDWIARWADETPEQREARHAAAERRYAHLRDQKRDWIANMRKDRPDAG